MEEADKNVKTGATPILVFVEILSSDLARTEQFYLALGLPIKREQYRTDPEHLVCSLGSTKLLIKTRRDGKDTTITAGCLGFAVASVNDAVIAATSAGGRVLAGPQSSPSGDRALVADPDGYRVELRAHSVSSPNTRSVAKRSDIDTANSDTEKTTSPSPDQLRVLNLIAIHQLETTSDISGKRIRAAIEDLGLNDALVAPLFPHLIQPTTQPGPYERYKLTFWGWYFSEHAPKVASLTAGVLDLLKTKYRKDPDLTHYAWSDLSERELLHNDNERYFIREILLGAQLSICEDSNGWRVPGDIEKLRKVGGLQEFLQYRANREIEDQLQMARIQRRISHNLDPFDDSMDSAIEELDDSCFDIAATDADNNSNESVNIFNGDIIIGSKNTSSVQGSTVGALAVGGRSPTHGSICSAMPDSKPKPDKSGSGSARRRKRQPR